jgi:hypothetical protein
MISRVIGSSYRLDLFLALTALALVGACGGSEGGGGGGGETETPRIVTEVRVSEPLATVIENETFAFTAVALDEEGTPVDGLQFGWRSSDEAIASVSEDGLATAHRPGVVQIVASVGDQEGSATLTVTEGEVEEVLITPSTIQLELGAATQMVARVLDANQRPLLGRAVKWTSEDPEIVSIDRDGLASAHAPGATKIAAEVSGKRATVRLEVLPRFAEIFTGNNHSCGLAADGTAWCWGRNRDGQLGIGSSDSHSISPRRVWGPGYVQLALGDDSSCGLSDAGEVWCWGSNDDEIFGRPEPLESNVPIRTGWRHPVFTGIWSGAYHACGLDEDGHAWCWGYNSSDFELGQPDFEGNSAVPLLVSAPEGADMPLKLRDLRLGRYFACGRTHADRLHCWGYNSDGQIGDGTTDSVGKPFEPMPGQAFSAYALGESHACGLAADGALFCWGDNWYGQLGDEGLGGGSLIPVEIDTKGKAFVSLALGSSHSCALDPSGAAWCWGSNSDGALGREGGDSFEPVEVSGGLFFQSLSSGEDHVCGLTLDREAYCWGENSDGQLGIGSSGDESSVPLPVTFE